MAAVDLSDLIEDLVFSMSAPGVDAFPLVSDDEWVSRLADGFWTGYNEGMYVAYTEVDGIVTHRTDISQTFPREFQQLVILYTAINSLRRQMMNMYTVFRTKAGPAEYEYQQSATLLNTLFNSLVSQKDAIVDRITKAGYASDVYVTDMYNGRQQGYRDGSLHWVGN